MFQKNLVRFGSQIGNWISDFNVMQGTPLSVAKEMLFEFIKDIGQIEDNAKAQQDAEAQKSSEEKIIPDPQE